MNVFRWRGANRNLRSYFYIVFLFGLICAAWDHFLLRGGRDFWDAHVYVVAMHTFASGGNAYLMHAETLPFVYPPFFLRLTAFVSIFFPAHLGWPVYLALCFLATCAIPLLLAASYIRSEWLVVPVAMLLFVIEPQLFGEILFLSGNLSSVLYALLLAAGTLGIRHNRWLPFYLAIIFASLIKPPFLAFLLLPLLAGQQQWLSSAGSVAAVAAGYLAQKLALPQDYAAFKSAVLTEILVAQDAGIGLFSYFLLAGKRVPGFKPLEASIAHLAVVGALVAGLFFVYKRKNHPSKAHLWIPALVVMAVLANPRMQSYDVCVAWIPATYICIDSVRAALKGGKHVMLVVAAIAVFVVLLHRASLMTPCILFLAAIVMTIYRMATPNVEDDPSSSETLPTSQQAIDKGLDPRALAV